MADQPRDQPRENIFQKVSTYAILLPSLAVGGFVGDRLGHWRGNNAGQQTGYQQGLQEGNEVGYREARPTELTGARIDGYEGNVNCVFLPGREHPSFQFETDDEGKITGLSRVVGLNTIFGRGDEEGTTTTTLQTGLFLDRANPTSKRPGVTITDKE